MEITGVPRVNNQDKFQFYVYFCCLYLISLSKIFLGYRKTFRPCELPTDRIFLAPVTTNTRLSFVFCRLLRSPLYKSINISFFVARV